MNEKQQGIDTAFLAGLLMTTAQQLEAIAREQDVEARRRKFMSVVQPVFYWTGDYAPELKEACDRIGRAFVEV